MHGHIGLHVRELLDFSALYVPGLLMMTLAIWFVFSIGIFLFGAEMNEVTGPFGYPLTYWFTCQGSLGIFVILIFWFANRQEKIDEEFGFSERGDD